MMSLGRELNAPRKMDGIGGALVLGATAMIVEFILIGLCVAVWNLPSMAGNSEGLMPPNWLQSTTWVKPGLMIMGLWGAMGSGNMLLYLAALTNVPPELYEAADIDGASVWQKFRNVTLPLLTPTIFFTIIMGIIGSFQVFTQGFIMTNGGPNNATTYYVLYLYQNAFNYLKIGYASALAWVLFFIILGITLVQMRMSRWVHYEGADA